MVSGLPAGCRKRPTAGGARTNPGRQAPSGGAADAGAAGGIVRSDRTRRRAEGEVQGKEKTGGACPIGAPGRREGGWNLEGFGPRNTLGTVRFRPKTSSD